MGGSAADMMGGAGMPPQQFQPGFMVGGMPATGPNLHHQHFTNMQQPVPAQNGTNNFMPTGSQQVPQQMMSNGSGNQQQQQQTTSSASQNNK